MQKLPTLGLSETTSFGSLPEKFLQSTLIRHNPLQNQQQQSPLFYCERCPSSFTRKWNLKQHIQFECGNKAPQFQCDLCSFRTKYKRNVKSHFMTVHLAQPSIDLKAINSKNQLPQDKDFRWVCWRWWGKMILLDKKDKIGLFLQKKKEFKTIYTVRIWKHSTSVPMWFVQFSDKI